MSEPMKKEAEKYGIPYEKDGRVLVWHDEFDEEKLDRTKWCFNRTMSGSDRVYDNSEKHIRVENGNLHMQVHRSTEEGKCYSLSEGCTTSATMNFKYGRAEMRANVPFRHGSWPSFWTQSHTPFAKADYMAEIDIFEVFASTHDLASAIHKWGGGQHVSVPNDEFKYKNNHEFEHLENLNNEYHIYAMEWDEKKLRFFVDDTCYAEFFIDEEHNFGGDIHPGMQGFHDPAFLIMNNEIFSPASTWQPSGPLTEDDVMPIDYYIDYVRVYQNPATDEIHLGDEIAAKRAENETKKA